MDDIRKKLNNQLLKQGFSTVPRNAILQKYQELAQGYSIVENALAVLSDMRSNKSHVYYGKFSKTLGITPPSPSEEIPSIWETLILELVHPDDLRTKYLHELQFFHLVRHLPPSQRNSWHYAGRLRMRDIYGNYIPVIHRIFYLPTDSGNSLQLSLCLYSPLWFDMPAAYGMAINSETGQIRELGTGSETASILTERERQVLRLIDKGLMSKQIAQALSISIHTVNRHRQEILKKLQVKSSIEACRVAKDLNVI